MSVRLMSMVFDLDPDLLKASRKIVLLAMADHANEDGKGIYPAVERICHKTSLCERAVHYVIAELRSQEYGLLEVVDQATPFSPYEYQINVERLEAFVKPYRKGGAPVAPQGCKESTPGVNVLHPNHHVNHHSNLTPAGAGDSVPTLEPEGESDDIWAGIPPQVVNVPQGGKKADREAYSERCDMCQADLSQHEDSCPDCHRPVEWHNSPIADKRVKLAKGKAADEAAKQKRENESRLSPTTAFVLGVARATDVTNDSRLGRPVEFIKGEEQALFEYERAYGVELLRQKTNEFKADGEHGRGLIDHLVNFLGKYNPSRGRVKKEPPARPSSQQIADKWED